MISILIPTYNYICTDLVGALQKQAAQLSSTVGEKKFCYEIIVADDCSTERVTVTANQKINELPHCRYELLTRNLGRAAIRNWLAKQAVYDHFLFIDSDAQICSSHFLADYWSAICPRQTNLSGPAPSVVCGGVRNVSVCPGKNYTLRYAYEAHADRRRNAAQRSKHPYDQFTTFNFLIARKAFDTIGGFQEKCKRYGYEDVYLGMELQQRQISILHIDNQLIHLGIDTNEAFIDKTETALKTLYHLNGAIKLHAHIGRVARQLEDKHLMGFIRGLFTCFRPLLRRNLLSSHPSLVLFQLYKLGFYAMLCKKTATGN